MFQVKAKALLIAGAMVLSMPAASFAKGGRGHHGEMMKAVEKLDLSAEQKAKLAEIKKSFKDTVKPKRKAMRAANEEVRAAMEGNASDEEIRKKFDASKAASQEFQQARFDKVMAIRAILTPEQRAKFKVPRGHGEEEE